MSKTSAIVFVSILVIGLIISLFVLNRCGKEVELPEQGETPAETTPETKPETKPAEPESPDPEKPAAPAAKGKEAPAKEKAKTDTKGKAKAETEAKPRTFQTAGAAMQALANELKNKDFDSFLKFVGPEAVAPAIREPVKAIIEDPALKLDSEKPSSEISKSATGERWALHFVPETGDAGKDLNVDLAGGRETPFRFQKVSLPLDLTSVESPAPPAPAPATTPGSESNPAPAKPAEPAPAAVGAADADALTIAQAFSKAIIDRNFNAARALADPSTVTDERVAALMIAVEEGGFQLREDRPMVVTLSRDDITWVLTRIQSEAAASEFALELGRTEGWKVNGLTFSKVLSALADKAGGGDVAYSPIVEDPMGGDSLVLYFEFDDDEVTPRGSRQLAIIADILSQGEERVIRINGHADALGTDQYNRGLSDRRAGAIREALISMGVKPEQVLTEAFGETKPRKPNFLPDGTDNPAGRSQNRRAEVYLDF